MREYIARLTQNSQDSPSANPIINTIGEITWTRTGTGEYIGLFPFGLIVADAFIYNPVRDNSGDVTTGSACVFTAAADKNGVGISAYGTPEDGSLQRKDIDGVLSIHILVFELC